MERCHRTLRVSLKLTLSPSMSIIDSTLTPPSINPHTHISDHREVIPPLVAIQGRYLTQWWKVHVDGVH